ncbi:TPA: acyltransferase family protein [Citrobacter freundii]|uniref:acyltransferase family protein n=1 Tax=Citrobacter TaxID=544 RepID=UPI000657AD70|nr:MULTISPECIES: acyltransferase [Citrobacter]KLV45011.1 hypothetical protein SK31_00767 [Citrobacter sp. MGH99]MDX7508640.1 acyltransferase [Citrobacter freundii]HCW3067461.1 acyltransferase [Citrobacter freundii]HCW3104542.1 acyltransferase [Citrobacter freundii]HCW3129963.1 acyltransferase [Citrobacter freundii]
MSFTNTDIFTISFLLISIIVSYISRKITPASPINVSNDNSLEGLRGMACLFVFINHASYSLNHIGINNFEMMGNSPYTGRMGAFGVEIFFCLTGYLFSKKIKNGGIDLSFFEKRIRRLAPAYIIISMFAISYFLFIKHDVIHNYYDISVLIQQVFGFGFFGSSISIRGISDSSLNAVTWTLPYEWKFYAIVPFLSVIYRKKKLTPLIIVFGISILCVDYWSNMFLWGYFVTGFLSSYINETKSMYIKTPLFIAMTVLVLYAYKGDFEIHGFEMFVIVSLFFMAFIMSRPKLFTASLFVYIGTISYSIYLSHQIITTIIMRCFSYSYDLTNIAMSNYLLLCALAVLITFIASAISFNMIEKKFITTYAKDANEKSKKLTTEYK